MLSSSIRALSKCCHALAHQPHLHEVVQAVCRMHDEGTAMSQDTICALVQACSEKKDLKSARIVHSLISSHGLDSMALLADYLIRLYASHGSLFEASFVFCRASQPSVYTWHAIISAYAMHGKSHRALELYQKMQQDGIKPDKYIFVCILKVCSSLKALTQGFLAHEQIVIGRLEADVCIGCALIEMYFECGSLKTARDIFEKLPNRDVMSWNVMMMAYASCGLCHPVFELFEKMQGKGFKPNTITFSCVLKACGSSGYLGQGRLIHSEIIEMASDSLPFIQRNLLDMYAKCGSLTDANKVFNNVLSRGDIVSWGMMIYGYVQHGHGALALEFFEKLQLEGMQPDRYIYPCVLKACGTIGAICQGRLLHDLISRTGLELDAFVGTALVDMYAKCGALEEARKVFDAIPHEHIVSWNAIIAGYVQHGYGLCALQVFADLQDQHMRPDNVTYLCSLKACNSIGDLGKGMLLHDQMIRRGVEFEVVIGSTLVEMYAKQGSLEEARRVFDKLPTQDIVSWGVMITGYAQHGHGLSALEFLEKMQLEGLQPNMFIFSCAVRACADLGAIGKGRVIHSEIIRSGLESDLAVGNTLVVLYCESGSLEAACRVFDRLSSRDVASWGAMISAYAQHGSLRQTIQCLQEMQHQGVKPNGPIYVSILVACSHAGQTQKGHWYFESMRKDHSITPTVEHLSCMIDLLGRAGCLNEGLKLLKSMPATSDAIAWMCLLTACRTYSNFKLGRQCFEKICQLDPTIAAAYVLMSNIYADAQMWEYVLEIQKLRMNAGVWKKPGRAWIEVGNKVQEFLVGDETHLQNNDIYSKLEELSLILRKEGLVPQSGSMILPFSLKEDEQDASSCKPALGFEDTCWHDRSKATTEIRKENVLIHYVYWALFLQFLCTVLYYLHSNEFLLCRCLATLSLVTHLNRVPMLESYRLLKAI